MHTLGCPAVRVDSCGETSVTQANQDQKGTGLPPSQLPPNITLEALVNVNAAKQEKEYKALSEGRKETVFVCR